MTLIRFECVSPYFKKAQSVLMTEPKKKKKKKGGELLKLNNREGEYLQHSNSNHATTPIVLGPQPPALTVRRCNPELTAPPALESEPATCENIHQRHIRGVEPHTFPYTFAHQPASLNHPPAD